MGARLGMARRFPTRLLFGAFLGRLAARRKTTRFYSGSGGLSLHDSLGLRGLWELGFWQARLSPWPVRCAPTAHRRPAKVSWRHAKVSWRHPKVSWRHAKVSWRHPKVSWRHAKVSWRHPKVSWRHPQGVLATSERPSATSESPCAPSVGPPRFSCRRRLSACRPSTFWLWAETQEVVDYLTQRAGSKARCRHLYIGPGRHRLRLRHLGQPTAPRKSTLMRCARSRRRLTSSQFALAKKASR